MTLLRANSRQVEDSLPGDFSGPLRAPLESLDGTNDLARPLAAFL
jgi:hypothetical protein